MGVDPKVFKAWKNQRRLTVADFRHYLHMVNPKALLFDADRTEFWDNYPIEGLSGMFDKQSRSPCGITQTCEDEINEGTEFEDGRDGLERRIFGNGYTWITLFKDDEELAKIAFDKNFVEFAREGLRPEMLADVSPADFMHQNYMPEESGEEELDEDLEDKIDE